MNTKTIAPNGSIYRAVLALALAGSCALAQSVESTAPAAPEVELAPVTVSAHDGVAVPYNQTGVSVSVLDVEQLKKEGIYSLSEALTTVPGVYVLPGGGSNQRGNTSELVIRGMSSQKYVMPMMDGMRLGGGMSSVGVLTSNVVARTPLFALGALELVRGAEGAVYGSGAMAGVLFMETPEGEGEPSLTLFNEYGSFDSYTGHAAAQGRVRNTAYYVSTSYERTNNDIRYADGSRPHAKHAGKSENWTEAVRLDHSINERNKLTLTYRRQDAEYRSVWGGYEFRSNLVTAKLQSRVSEKYTTSLMGGYFGDFNDLSGYFSQLHNVQVEWRNAYKWNDIHKTTAGAAWARTDFTTKSDGARLGDSSGLDSVLSLFAEHTVAPVRHWSSSLALRLDQSNVYDALCTLRASTNYRFNRERTRVFASAGRGYAAPSSFQRSDAEYHGSYAIYHGNPNLHCETNRSADLGAEHELVKDHFLSATLFLIRTEDGITPTTADGYHYSYVNAPGHRTNQGIELAVRGTFERCRNTGYTLAFTLAQPKTSDDRQIENTARRTWTADVHTSPVKGLTTGLGLTAAGNRTTFDGRRVDNFLVLRWYANYEVNERLSLHVRVENLTNQKFEAEPAWDLDPAGTMLNPGTAVYAGCTVKF